jgi:flagellin
MALSILNNIPSLMAQNQLAITNQSLQQTLFRLSSGSRINSGADDAAGLAIADGLRANISALTQSARNANDGVGALQVADGALAQVTSLLNRAVTLATESATGTVGDPQRVALNAEFTAIKAEIDRIGTNTTFNGTAVFSATPTAIYLSDGGLSSTVSVTTKALSSTGLGLGAYATGALALTGLPTADDTITINGTAYTFKAAASAAGEVTIGSDVASTLANLKAAINGTDGINTANADVVAGDISGGSLTIHAKVAGVAGDSITLAASLTGNVGGWVDGASTLTGGADNGDLSTAANAQAALTIINNAIADVASRRGDIGASINRLQAAVNVIKNQTQNLSAAEDGIRAADVGQEVANMAKYQILTQTGIAALAQANSMQQSVLKLLQ